MSSYYFCGKLRDALNEVKKEHPLLGKGEKYVHDDQILKDLIIMVVSWNSDSLDKSMQILEEYQISMISSYLVKNKYHVKCDNLFYVIFHMGSGSDYWQIFTDWQNNINNSAVKHFLDSLLDERKMTNSLKDHLASADLVKKWIKSSKIIQGIMNQVGEVDSFSAFEYRLIYCAIIQETYLWNECIKRFLMVCTRSTYLNYGEHKLLLQYKGFTVPLRREFLANFLCKMSLADLESMKDFFEAIENSMKTVSLKKDYAAYLEKRNVWDKYLQWKKIIELIVKMDDPNRSVFWKKYILDGKLVDYGASLCIYFDNYVVTEFKGKAAGPAYLYTKEYYDREVKWKQLELPKTKFQSYESENQYRDDKTVRLPHSPKPYYVGDGWHYKFERCLKEHGIYSHEYN